MTRLPLDRAALGVLNEGRQVHVAVSSARGPHVTPDLFAWSGDRLWFAAATPTVKAKVLARRPRAGAVVVVGDRSVVLAGEVEVVDPTHPRRLARQLRRLPDAAAAMTRFTVRNAPDLLAFVGDTALGRLGRRLPPPRAVFGLTPAAAAVLDGGVLTAAWGEWEGVPTGNDGPAGTPGPPGWDVGDPVVAALPGPVALPARWRQATSELVVPQALLDHLALSGSFPLGFVGDEYGAPGPAAKQGILVRGTGTVGEGGVIRVEGEEVVAWDGVDTERADLDDADDAGGA